MHFNESPGALACMSCVYAESPDEMAHERHVASLLGVSVDAVRSNFVDEPSAKLIAERYTGLAPAELLGLAYDSLFKQLCGEGSLKDAADRQVLAPFAFVSILAGVVLAAEFARRLTGEEVAKPFNYARLSPWSAPIPRMRQQRPKNPNCEFCNNQLLQSIVLKLWG